MNKQGLGWTGSKFCKKESTGWYGHFQESKYKKEPCLLLPFGFSEIRLEGGLGVNSVKKGVLYGTGTSRNVPFQEGGKLFYGDPTLNFF